MKLKPVFDDLNETATILNHFEELTKIREDKPHTEILKQLIEQFEPLDFEALAFPQVKGLREQLGKIAPESEQAKEIHKQLNNLKLNLKHFLVLSIENALLYAEKNRWGLCKNHDFIYLYNGSFWAEINKEIFQKFLVLMDIYMNCQYI